jgi:hypothetical protein
MLGLEVVVHLVVVNDGKLSRLIIVGGLKIHVPSSLGLL